MLMLDGREGLAFDSSSLPSSDPEEEELVSLLLSLSLLSLLSEDALLMLPSSFCAFFRGPSSSVLLVSLLSGR